MNKTFPGATETRSLLLLNWRDPWHPAAGGAELVTLRVVERLCARGWDIEWFSAAYKGAPIEETINGIRYVRAGSQVTVHARAFLRYRKSQFDVVIDQVNTIPFMTPLYRQRHIGFFHQLAMEVWQYEKGAIIGSLGRALEPLYLMPYRHSPIITVSESTSESLREIGMSGPMFVIPEAVDEVPDHIPPRKDPLNNLLVLGRVTPSKRIEESIKAAALLRGRGWTGRLIIAGGGKAKYVSKLRRVCASLGLADCVEFKGRVTGQERQTLLRDSAALLMTSVREGWGLVVTEAGRHWTPSVVYDVPGLREAVHSGETGYVTEPNPAALADHVYALLNGDYQWFSRNAWEFACSLTWEATAFAFEQAVIKSRPRGGPI